MKKIIISIMFMFVVINISLGQETDANNLTKPKLLKKTSWGYGIGFVVDQLPIGTAEFKMPVTSIYYDYALMSIENMADGWVTPGLSVGLYGMGGFLPIPETELFGIFNNGEELMIRLGIGGFYDIIFAGHAGLTLKLGVIIDYNYEVTLIGVPLSADPVKPYNEVVSIGPKNIITPYFGLLITFRR